MPRHDMPPAGTVADALSPPAVRVGFESAKKVIYVALGGEVRYDKKLNVIACLRCVRPACPHVNAVRVHLGLRPLPRVRYPEDEAPASIEIPGTGGMRLVPERHANVPAVYYDDEVA